VKDEEQPIAGCPFFWFWGSFRAGVIRPLPPEGREGLCNVPWKSTVKGADGFAESGETMLQTGNRPGVAQLSL
jgi:hypothetical protein